MKRKNLIGLIFLAGFGSLLLFSFGQQVGGYMDFAEAERTGSRAHVVGQWIEDQPHHYDPAANVFSFHMADEFGVVHQVHYNNPKPASFEDAEKLVVEGRLSGDVFEAEHILMKCPSKYNDTRDLERAAGAS